MPPAKLRVRSLDSGVDLMLVATGLLVRGFLFKLDLPPDVLGWSAH